MKQIEIKILNPEVINEAEKMMVAMARLTQKGHKITDMVDFELLLNQPYSEGLVKSMSALPHPTIQKFGVINIAVVGASRRFLAQITRHQNEIKFMSGSLQYSDYTDKAKFVVPYEVTKYDDELTDAYIEKCTADLAEYEMMAKLVGKDAAGYKMPQGMRNVLLMSATPYQFKHMIRQRTCNRNTLETQYVMALIWEQLWPLSDLFHDCGPFCTAGPCPEGKMRCGQPFRFDTTPTQLLDMRFPLIRR
jgi:thymidylate synthase (FAD)